MSYTALYRKFRPRTFAEVKGQEHVVRTIQNQIKNRKTGHAYLFTGTRGTGKTSVAKIMAKALDCLAPEDGEPCNCCENCLAIDNGSFLDVVEMDAASNNGVDDIRQLIDEVRYTPAKGRYKVFIIDEAHMITKSAFNAFLKTLEEPPEYAVFILATTEPHKLPQTILSRLQRYDFRRIPADVIKSSLKELADREGAAADEKALDYIARLGDGSMRDAVSLLDKCIAFSLGQRITYEMVLDALGAADTEEFSKLLRAVYAADTSLVLEYIDAAAAQGKELARFVEDFCAYLRNVLLVSINPQAAEKITGISAENMALLREDAAFTDSEIIIRYIRILSELLNRMRFSSVKRLLAEVEFIKLTRPQMETDYASLLDRIRQLENRPAAAVREAEAGKGQEAAADNPEGAFYAERAAAYASEQEAFGAGEPPAAEGAASGPGVNWDEILEGVESGRLRTTLKKAQVRNETEGLCIYVQGVIAKNTAESGTGEIKRLLKEKGLDTEVIVKEGVPADAGTETLKEEDLFKNINFEIGEEDF